MADNYNPIIEFVIEFAEVDNLTEGTAEYSEYKKALRCDMIDLRVEKGKIINTENGLGVIVTDFKFQISTQFEKQDNINALTAVAACIGGTPKNVKIKKAAKVCRDSKGVSYTEWELKHATGVNAKIITDAGSGEGAKSLAGTIYFAGESLKEADTLTYIDAKMDDKDKLKWESANQAVPAYQWPNVPA